MPDEELPAARTKPAYRAGIWALRVMLGLMALGLPLTAGGVVHDISPGVRALLFFAYSAPALATYALLDRAGVRIFGLSHGIWRRRRMVYRDVFGLGRRDG